MGHLRISLAVAGALTARSADSTALVVTGFAGYTRMALPPRVDTLKLPVAPVSSDPRWGTTAAQQPSKLSIAPDLLLQLRGELCLAAVRSFAPQIVLCDYLPLGRGGDLRPALEWLRGRGATTVALAIRDFDDTEELRSYWDEERVQTVCRLFDLALVYNPGEIDSLPAQALQAAGLPVYRTSLVGAPIADATPVDLGEGYLLVTAGGGIDGFPLLNAVIGAIRASPLSIPTVLVTGPMMPDDDVARLRQQAGGLNLRIERFRSDMNAVLAGARAVISMAGYAIVAEILGSGKPALLAPRTTPRGEQLHRARYWSGMGAAELLEPSALGPDALSEAIADLLERQPTAGEPLTGAAEAAEILARAARR